MKRWNGWGDNKVVFPLTSSAIRYLQDHLGKGSILPDCSLESILERIPPSSLPFHPLIQTDPFTRLSHARGQSLPDWIALRSGRIGTYPEGVAYPASGSEIRELYQYCKRHAVQIIPYGGGTSVVGHINPLAAYQPTVTINTSQMKGLLDLDQTNQLAVFEAGIQGPELEENLTKRGYTLGHFPQSFEFSSLGGWIATRSTGQQSYYYGRIEALFCGGQVETPVGTLDIPALPASAAGPDLRHLILGSEGRFGIITRACVRIRILPEIEQFYGCFFPNWSSGLIALREIAQAGVNASMLRLSDSLETESTLALSGKDRLVIWAKRGLNLLGFGAERSLLLFGITGKQEEKSKIISQLMEITKAQGGSFPIKQIGQLWKKNRFLAPYLRNTLWELGYAIDTLETALPWSGVEACTSSLKTVLVNQLEHLDEKVLAFAHLSHVYPDGASVYITYLFRRADDPDETLRRWRLLKHAASQVIVDYKGTISHQHGVGIDHAEYLALEKGQSGMDMLRAVQKSVDPQGLMNPGKLLA